MDLVISSMGLGAGVGSEQFLPLVVQCGVRALELTVGTGGWVDPDPQASRHQDLEQAVRDAGLRIALLTPSASDGANLAAVDPQERERALAHVVTLLDVATRLEVGAVVVRPAFRWDCVGSPKTHVGASRPNASYVDAHARVCEAMSGLRFEAQARAIELILDAAADRFLTSPLEMRRLVDRVNSPWVRVGFGIDVVSEFGDPCDWVATAGGRLAAMWFSGVTGTRRVLSQARRVGFGGAIVVRSPPAQWPAAISRLVEAESFSD